MSFLRRLTRASCSHAAAAASVSCSAIASVQPLRSLSTLVAFPSCRSWTRTQRSLRPAGQLSVFVRHSYVHGNEVKVGQTIKWEGKTCSVLSTTVSAKGRGHTTYLIEMRDINSGNKSQVRLRPADKVELRELQQVKMNFLYRQGSTLFFMDPTSFEQVELSVDLASGKAGYYLIDNSSVVLKKDGDQFVSIQVPEKVVCTVQETAQPRKTVNDPSGKEALLTNGQRISVPHFIENGQHIVVNTATETYVGKSEVPPEPEEDRHA